VPNDHVHRARDVPRLKSAKTDPRAPVQQLLGTFVWHASFGPGTLAHCSIGSLFSPLSFYVDGRFTSLPHDSPQTMRLATPPSPLIVSAHYPTRISNQVLSS
jgi:hypothetical protein